ncbi:MAG TPA: type II secretion system F family protein [Alphaproteobacteria bacterium]|nr:type II secretion system F family protein [Alphaproteobacteria bacterium]HNS44114.1 type II secretion system F family protein [Alphaproteobacteria bacterium]
MPSALIIFLVALVVSVILGMIAALMMSTRKDQQKRALSIIAGEAVVSGEDAERNSRDKRRADLAKKLQDSNATKSKKSAEIKDKLQQAGFANVPVKNFWIASILSGTIVTLLLLSLSLSKVIVVLGAFVGFFGLPRLFLKFKIKRRQKKFLEDFPDALEAMVRLLKAGMPVGEAISMVSREFTGPVGEEMARVYDEQKIGITMADACLHAAERMPITEMQMFATGIAIQQQTGSSLSEILTNLARVIRARFRLKRKVQALSSEAKSSAMIIGSLPILVASGLYAINPEYMYPLFYTLKGKFFLGGAIFWMSVGGIIMRQMINFKV